jgi:hypothetical protein
MSAAQVLDEAMPDEHHPGATVLLEAAHRSQPGLQPTVIGLDPVVGVSVGAMPCEWQQLLQYRWVHRRLIGDDLGEPDLGRADGPLEELVGGRGISPSGDQHVDDLAELVDRSVDVAPLPCHLHIGFIDLPAVTDGVPTRPGGLGQQWREPQYPPVDRDVVNLDPALSEELFDVAVGQGEAQVPADREDDDIRWEAEAGKGGPRSGRARAAVLIPAVSLSGRRRRGCNSAPLRTLQTSFQAVEANQAISRALSGTPGP